MTDDRLTDAALAAQAQEWWGDHAGSAEAQVQSLMRLLCAVRDAARACEGPGLVCCDCCDRTHAHGCLHPWRTQLNERVEEVRQLREAAEAVSLSVRMAPAMVLGVPLGEMVIVSRDKMQALQIWLARARAATEPLGPARR